MTNFEKSIIVFYISILILCLFIGSLIAKARAEEKYQKVLTPIGIFTLIEHRNHWDLQHEFEKRRGLRFSVSAFTDIRTMEIHFVDKQGLEHEIYEVCCSWESFRREAEWDMEFYLRQKEEEMSNWIEKGRVIR